MLCYADYRGSNEWECYVFPFPHLIDAFLSLFPYNRRRTLDQQDVLIDTIPHNLSDRSRHIMDGVSDPAKRNHYV